MGEEIPDDWPTLEDNLFYRISVDRFEHGPIEGTCDNAFIDSTFCCIIGWEVKAWIAGNKQCQSNPLCPGLPFGNSQRITNITGPSDTWAQCMGF